MNAGIYEQRVRELELEGMSTSDAQAVADAEEMTAAAAARLERARAVAASHSTPADCTCEDCDQRAIYCAGHAREFAAPERDALLAALREVSAELEAQLNDPSASLERGFRIAERARAAIARAEQVKA